MQSAGRLVSGEARRLFTIKDFRVRNRPPKEHPEIASSLQNAAQWYAKQGNIKRALEYMEQALAIGREVFGERHSSTINAAADLVRYLIRLNRREEAYGLVAHFLTQAPLQDPSIDRLKNFELQLLSKPIRKGFRPSPKIGKRKTKKKRR